MAESNSSQGLSENVAGMLAYITFIPALIFILIEPYNKNPFVRFHSFQSLFFSIAWIVIEMALGVMSAFLGFLRVLVFPIYGVLGLIAFVLWIVCLVKAYNHEKFMIPVIGKMAEDQAAKI